MPEIEFIETQPTTQPERAARVSARSPGTILIGLIPVAFALAGAALATLAPFRPLYVITEPSRDVTSIGTDQANGPIPMDHLKFDGWGRVRAQMASDATTGHGVRYGIVFAAIAGVFVLAAVAVAEAALLSGTRWTRRALVGGRLLAVAAIAGVTALSATSYLAYLPLRDEVRELGRSLDDPSAPVDFSVAPGNCWLIAAAAALAGLAAVGSSLLIARLARGDDDVDGYVSQTPPSLSAYGGGNYPGGDTL